MADEQQRTKGDIVPRTDAGTPSDPSVLRLGGTATVDLQGLTEEQAAHLRMKHAESMIDVSRKAQELKVDVGALDATLSTMASNTKQVSEAGDHVTITHAQSNALGRTEVMMGNTDKAAKGKLSRSQTGESDYTLTFLAVGAVMVIILALIMFH